MRSAKIELPDNLQAKMATLAGKLTELIDLLVPAAVRGYDLDDLHEQISTVKGSVTLSWRYTSNDQSAIQCVVSGARNGSLSAVLSTLLREISALPLAQRGSKSKLKDAIKAVKLAERKGLGVLQENLHINGFKTQTKEDHKRH